MGVAMFRRLARAVPGWLSGHRRTRLGARWIVGALLIAPLGSAAAQGPARPPTDILLRPGDALRITVWRHPELSGEFVVAPDSTLVHPVYQVVKVAGPLPMAKERLRRLLTTYEQDVQLVMEPLFPVTVAGEVRLPNLYRLPQGTTMAQAIAQAGGPTELGSLGNVRVIRRDSAIAINLASGYSRYEALAIASGDQVLVARRSSFNLVRDVLVPLTSVTAAVAAILAYTRR
jgi:protein involved in polysaccharide export with SLBB domain